MIDLASLGKILGGGATTGLATIGAAYALFTPLHDFDQHVAKAERGDILQLVKDASNAPAGDYKALLCKSLEEQISELCAIAPTDSLCVDRATLKKQAGC